MGDAARSRIPPGGELLTGDTAGALLEAAVRTDGRELRRWTVRAVHRRGRSLSVLYGVVTGDGDEELLVGHVATHPVPEGGAELTVGDARIHVWRYPEDPYLPGLPSAASPARVRELLDAIGAAPGRVRLRMRSYRPSRRAVIEVTVVGERGSSSVLFLKVLGGRTPERVQQRTRDLVLPHRELHRAGLPVPAVLGVAEEQGIVALTAVAGRTLRGVLVDTSTALPGARPFIELSRLLAAVPLRTPAEPRRFAAAHRHVDDLTGTVPDLAGMITAVAEEADLAGGPTGTVHGDLHDGQLLLRSGSVSGLLDVDGAGTGLLAHDAGRLIAYVDSLRERGGAVADRGGELARSLFDGYVGIAGEDHLRRAVAGARLSLATGPARSREGDWRAQTRERVVAAARWLEG